MKRPSHPLLFGPFIVLGVLSPNLNLVPPNEALRPMIALVVLTTLLWIASQLAFRNWVKSGAFASTTVLFLFAFGFVPFKVPLLAYLLVTLSCSALIAKRSRSPELLNVLAISLFVVSLGNVAIKVVQARAATAQVLSSTSSAPRQAPDVYFIVLDGYGRSDVLKEKIGYDNSRHIASLKELGFKVLTNSRSNYCQTELSLGATLNLEFIQDLIEVPEESSNRLPLQQIIATSRVQQRFRDMGYTTIAITTGFPPTEFPNSDLNLQVRGSLSLLEDTLINLTPLKAQTVFRDSMFSERRRTLNGAFQSLSRTKGDALRPRFILAHIVAPHPPFVFDADGNPTENRGLYGYWDGSDYTKYVGDKASYANGYSAQADYITKRLLASLRDILNGDKTPPIIIIQGDHGSKMGLQQNSLDGTDIDECFPILSAVYAPDTIAHKFRNDESPVNTFRHLFSSLFSESYEPLPNRSWFSPFYTPYKFTEVTEMLKR